MNPTYNSRHGTIEEQEQAQEPVAHLYCGGQFGNELDEWEIDPEQYQCDRLNEHFGTLGKKARIPLYAAPQPARKLPAEDEEVYNAIKGVDSLDALAVWRAAERFYGIGGAA